MVKHQVIPSDDLPARVTGKDGQPLAARGDAIGSRSARASGVRLIGSEAAAVRDGGGPYGGQPGASLHRLGRYGPLLQPHAHAVNVAGTKVDARLT